MLGARQYRDCAQAAQRIDSGAAEFRDETEFCLKRVHQRLAVDERARSQHLLKARSVVKSPKQARRRTIATVGRFGDRHDGARLIKRRCNGKKIKSDKQHRTDDHPEEPSIFKKPAPRSVARLGFGLRWWNR